MTSLALLSFLAGALTILAPCVLPVLPVILAGSVGERGKWYPYIITLSLALSITLFTIILKVSTLFIDIPSSFWKYLSGGILIFLGLTYLFPHAWSRVATLFGGRRANVSLDRAQNIESSSLRAIVTGAALGPVFSTCSPTYSLLLATVFPVSFVAGVSYTLIYSLGLALMLLLIVWGGRSIISKFRVFADESGWFRRILGIIFLLIGLAIISGIDKRIETYVLERFDVSKVESGLLDRFIPPSVPVPLPPVPVKAEDMPVDPLAVSTGSDMREMQKPLEPPPEPQIVVSVKPTAPVVPAIAEKAELKKVSPIVPAVVTKVEPKKIAPIVPVPEPISPPVPEPILPAKPSLPVPDLSITTPYTAPEIPSSLTEWIQSSPLTMKSLRGKVVLIDFWTLGCINCQRTLPYITSWDRKYRDQGFVVIGVHAPEFAYEKVRANIDTAIEKYNIDYPVLLDNDFTLWNSYNNHYWPALYFIDKEGKVRHTHFGEGSYENSEKVIQYLLNE